MEEKIQKIKKAIAEAKALVDDTWEKMRNLKWNDPRAHDLGIMFNYWDGQRCGMERVLTILGIE